jgi:hypothetical protein
MGTHTDRSRLAEQVELESVEADLDLEVWDRMCKLYGLPRTFHPAR